MFLYDTEIPGSGTSWHEASPEDWAAYAADVAAMRGGRQDTADDS